MAGDETKPAPSKTAAETAPLPAHELFRGRREIEISYRHDIYRLRITRNDKLILTK